MSSRCILVSLDLTDATNPVLTEARRLARAYNARIRLLHVRPDSHGTGGMEFELADHLRFLEAQKETARTRLAHYAKMLSREGFQTDVSLAEGDTRKVLLDEARARDPAAIVIGARVHAAMHDILFGGNRRSLIKKGARPVLVAPASKRQGGRRGFA